MKITIAQLNPTIGDFSGNLKKAGNAMQTARKDGADLVVFPELFLTGYPPRDLLERNDFIQNAKNALLQLIADSRQVPDLAVICGTVLSNNGSLKKQLSNAAVVIHNGKLVFSQDKSLLPTYDVFDETRYFVSSQQYQVYHWKNEKIGLTICEDAWNDPELFFHGRYSFDPVEELVRKNASIIINLSASPFHIQKEALRYRLIQNHVKKHHVAFLLVNQVGGQDELIFDGRSMVFHSSGELQNILPAFKEHIETIDLNAKKRTLSFNQAPEIESVYQALTLGLRDYLMKCGIHQVVIGLSGGIDSSLVACIAKEALGSENVLGIAMPSMYSASDSLRDASILADNLKISFLNISIKEIYDSYMQSLKDFFSETLLDATEENIQARIRGNILMAVSNKFGYIPLATGNKSELSVGYCTMYGDMSGGLSVIGDVPKTMVYQLARFINHDKEIIPENVLTRAPTAELKPDQKDQDTLPPYEILDRIIDLYVDQMRSYQEIVDQGLDPDTVQWVIQTISKNEYKRRQAAPVLKVTSKAFGTGRRMPIAAKYQFGWTPPGIE